MALCEEHSAPVLRRMEQLPEKGGVEMQVVVMRSPKYLRGLLCRLFGIKKER